MRTVLLAVAVGLAGCGDNSRVCGPGTLDENGICQPAGSGTVCGDGTVLDPLSGDCQVDPSVCGNGTVLIDGECKDPAEGVIVDLLEAIEPNGFEADATPAGIITLKAVGGGGYVIHGCVKPLGNNTPDLDRYILTVTGPTLIHVAADGIDGLAAGFLVRNTDGNPLLAGWQRLGISLLTDVSKREVFLPTAGTYDFIITDSRTLQPITEGGTTLPAAGDLEGNSCYYTTLTARTITPVSLALATGDAGMIGEELKFYTAAFPSGFTSLVGVVDPEDIDDDGLPDIESRAASSIVVLNNGVLRQISDADSTTPVSTAFVGGVQPGDDPLIVLDYVWNMTLLPTPYSLEASATVDSQALSTSGGTINATSKGRFLLGPGGVAQLANVNLFHWDVADNANVDGFDLTSTIQLQGSIVDDTGAVVAKLTGTAGNQTSSTTFAAYKGLIRTPLAGRYYFMVFAPRNAVGTAFSITSRIVPQTLDPITLDTPLTRAVNGFDSNALTYDGSGEPWQLFNATGTNTGVLTVELLDPATAFGRLDRLVIRTGAGAGNPGTLANDCGAACDLDAGELQHRFSFAANGSTPAGRILRNAITLAPAAVTSFVVKVNPTTTTGVRNFTLDFETRVYDDFAGPAIPAGTTKTLANQVIDNANRERRYYFETDPANRVTITATPTGTPPTLNVEIAQIDTREADTRVVDVSPLTAAETLALTQSGGGFTAFKIRGGIALATGSYTLTVKVDPP